VSAPGANLFTGLILASGRIDESLAPKIVELLAPFTLVIRDMQEIRIRDRQILTILVELDRAHASAVEADLTSAELSCDIAIDFAEYSLSDTHILSSSKILRVISTHYDAQMLLEVFRAIQRFGSIGQLSRVSISPYTVLDIETKGLAQESYLSLLLELRDKGITALYPGMQGPYLVICDMDSTFIQEEVIDLLAEHAGVGSEVSDITAAAMRGELDFSQSLERRVALLKGLSSETLSLVRAQINPSRGALDLVTGLHRDGHRIGIVSGGFLEVIEPLLKEWKIDFYKANSFEIADGKLTGRITGPIVDRSGKADALLEFSRLTGIPPERCIAVGDGANDGAMLEIAGLGVAYRAKGELKKTADVSIEFQGLDALLHFIPR
jgi:phosphoserine phosphatase